MDYKLIEQFKEYAQPVGSVLETPEGKIFYRNINDKHVFKKNNYTALFIDDAVVSYLVTNDKPDKVVFDYSGKTTTGTYSIAFTNYERASVKNMAGRKQRGVSLESFIFTPTPTKHEKPPETKYIVM